MKRLLSLGVLLLFVITMVTAQDVVGIWKTIDDETGKARSYVKVYKAQNGMFYGKVTKLLNRTADEPEDPTCIACPENDYRYNKKVMGMTILTKLKKSGEEYVGGQILDPKKGKIYKCKIWTEGKNTLKVRGYVGPFFRTQTWHRVE